MNKSYVYLSMDELLVIDEKGNAKKRNFESENLHEILLLENDLEKINAKIEELENIINDYEKHKLTKKESIILYMLPFISLMPLSLTALLVSSSLLFPAILAIALVSTLLDLCLVKFSKDNVKINNGKKNELLKAYELRDNFKDKLNEIKTKNLVNQEEKSNIEINQLFYLEDFTSNYEEASKQLYEANENGYKGKVKSLKLKTK